MADGRMSSTSLGAAWCSTVRSMASSNMARQAITSVPHLRGERRSHARSLGDGVDGALTGR